LPRVPAALAEQGAPLQQVRESQVTAASRAVLAADALAETTLLRRADQVALPRQGLGVVAIARQLLPLCLLVGIVAQDVLHGWNVAMEDHDRFPRRSGRRPQQIDRQARSLADVKRMQFFYVVATVL